MREVILNGKRVLCEVVPKDASNYGKDGFGDVYYHSKTIGGFAYLATYRYDIKEIFLLETISEEQILKLSPHLITSKAKSEIEFFIEESGITWTESETILIIEIK